MADNTVLNANTTTGNTFRTLEDGSSIQWPVGVTAFATTVGTPDVLSVVTPTAGLPVRLADGSGYLSVLPVSDNGGSLTVDGTVAATQSGTWTVTGAGGTFPVTDSGGSLTVDAPVGSPVFVQLSDGAAPITTLPVSISATVLVQGKNPSDAVSTANPVLAGAYASAAAPTNVSADGDAVSLWADLAGRLQIGDGGGSLTIDNATLSVTGGGVEASALRVTLASDSTGVLSVDDNGGSLTVDGTVAATQSGTWTVTGAGGTFPVTDSGGSLTVDAPVGTPVFVRLSDGTSPITTLPVSIASVPSHAVTNAGTFAVQVDGDALTSLQLIDDVVFAEDAAHSSGDKGVQVLAVRRDTAASSSGTSGDYSTLNVDSTGRLWCNVSNTVTVGSHDVTNAGTFAVQAEQSGTWTVTGAGGTFPVTDNSGSLTVDAPVGTPVFVRLSDGTSPITTLPVSIASVPSHAVTNAGTFAVQESGAALTALQLIDNLVLAEDAVAGSGDPGVQVLAVRRDTAASSSDTDGDYSTLSVDSTGRLWCNVSNTVTVAAHNVTNAGTFAVQAAQSGTWNVGTVTTVSTITNVVHVDDNSGSLTVDGTVTAAGGAAHDAPVSGNPNLIAGYASAAAPTNVSADGDAVQAWYLRSGAAAIQPTYAGVLAKTGNGASGTGVQRVTIANDSTGILASVTTVGTITNVVHVDDNSGSLTVDGTVTAAGGAAHDAAVSGNPNLIAGYASAAAPTNVSADGDVVNAWYLRSGAAVVQPTYAGVLATTGNGASGTGVPRVTIANDSTGILAGVTTVSTVTSVTQNADVRQSTASNLNAQVVGNVAHDSAASGNPVSLGATAETTRPGITLVADGDVTRLYAGVDGVLIVRNHCNLEDVVQERTTNTDGASTAFASGLAAPGSGVRLWITTVTVCNSSASFCTVDLRDGSAGSVLWTLPVPATGGVTMNFDPPLRLTANTALAFDASAATSTLTIAASGFKSKV